MPRKMTHFRAMLLATVFGLAPISARADSTLLALPSAGPLTGSEYIYSVQGKADRKISLSQIATFVRLNLATDLLLSTVNINTPAGSPSAPHGLDFNMYAGIPDANQQVGPVWNVTNITGNAGLGQTSFYFTNNTTGPKFDIGHEEVMFARGSLLAGNTTIPNYQAHWLVGVGPQAQTGVPYTFVTQEVNITNRAGDDGVYYPDVKTNPQLTGGVRFVPETKTFGDPGTGYNVAFGFHVGHSDSLNTLGKAAQTKNPIGVEYDATAPNGVSYEAQGDSYGVTANYPLSPLWVRGGYSRGIHIDEANILDGNAIVIRNGQSLAISDGNTGFGRITGQLSGGTGPNSDIVIGPQGGSILPQFASTTDLGAQTFPFRNAYTYTVNANAGYKLNGNTIIDGAGNLGLLSVTAAASGTFGTFVNAQSYKLNGNQIIDPSNNAGFNTITTANGGVFNGPIKLASSTVAALPTCNAGSKYSFATVSDANAPSWNAVLVGGGAVVTGALCNGTAWTAH